MGNGDLRGIFSLAHGYKWDSPPPAGCLVVRLTVVFFLPKQGRLLAGAGWRRPSGLVRGVLCWFADSLSTVCGQESSENPSFPVLFSVGLVVVPINGWRVFGWLSSHEPSDTWRANHRNFLHLSSVSLPRTAARRRWENIRLPRAVPLVENLSWAKRYEISNFIFLLSSARSANVSLFSELPILS